MEVRQLDKNGMIETRKKSEDTSVKLSMLKSTVWETFLLIFDRTNNKKIRNFVKCSKCSSFVAYNGSTTTSLKSHECNKLQTIDSFLKSEKTKLSKNDIDAIRDAATEFIVRDIRPFYAIEGEGLRNLLKTMIRVGKNYRMLSEDDIKRLLPARMTMHRHVDKKAVDATEMIKADIAKSIQSVGGFIFRQISVQSLFRNNGQIEYNRGKRCNTKRICH